MLAAHADWSAHPAKRWFTLARRTSSGWAAEAPRPVGDPASLTATFLSEGVPVAFGLDLPLGVPRAWAATRPEPDFPAFLRTLTPASTFFSVSPGLDTVCHERPFYPARGIAGMTRAAHAAALGFPDARGLSRACDRATAERPAGAPLFWTLGANQTGKAAIAAWRDWIGPSLAAGVPLDLHPFDGGLHALLSPGRAALAEVYPAEGMRHIGVRLSGSKRDRDARRTALPMIRDAMSRLRVAPDTALDATLNDAFGADAAGEDRMDSLLGLLALIGVLDGHRPDFIPDDPWIRRWEGWVLGQTAMPLEAP